MHPGEAVCRNASVNRKTVTPMHEDQAQETPANSAMTVREAGKRGGDAVRKKYGPSFYEEIGRKGGERTKERHGNGFYGSIGQKGGNAVKDKYGTGFYEAIGHKGGQKVKRLIEEAKKAAS